MGYLDDGYAKKGLTWSALPAPMLRAREPGETCTRCGNFHELAPECPLMELVHRHNAEQDNEVPGGA
ncbi:MAG: hypothetical protein A3A33_00245 [Candidatus Yanofskybacteria bacterium RIFCSPLOWO2_01_FULL_49_25]|uniref:Uncharacterized protein n=1 Tax=Candidatus Yanofskybacteria bacterium RIFCSPLOWO2_01_FULL_49_25 TaxID=1802701 RepID=A0A1F8GUG2_9BACT|nr:MAG: hypothetical protein A3A33_00245 [Candidatus Yanofskybacteria bacterium RIFCSPLOWO2_01_FULL_49_25]